MDNDAFAQFFKDLSQGSLLGSPLWRWLALLGTLVAFWGVAAVVRRVARSRLKAVAADGRVAPHAILGGLQRTRPLLWVVIGVAPGLRWLTLGSAITEFGRGLTVVALGVQIALSLSGALLVSLDRERSAREADGRFAEVSSFGLLRAVGLSVVWSVALLGILANLGVEITAMVASLGVGGIAIALAAQNVLGDLLASLSIVLDRPFEVGDFIVVGPDVGTVERIGLKTTRVKSLSGEQLVFGNSDLLTSRVRNFKRMKERRVVLKFGLLYSSPSDKVQQVPGEVKGIIEAQDGVRFDRAHFCGFGESALDFEVVYWILSPEYNDFMNTQQRVNLALLGRVRELELEFAFPTRTLHVAAGLEASRAT